jgi:ketosteroid isomerase-like protein
MAWATVAVIASAGCSLATAAESVHSPATVAKTAIPSEPAELRALVLDLDRRMFDAYNAHDVNALMAMFDADLEFFHDTGGLLNFDQVKAGFTSVFAGNKDIRRELVPGSLEVYPIKDYGAIEVGEHRFCHTENGRADCGTFKFVQVWHYSNGDWKVTRDLSYGH